MNATDPHDLNRFVEAQAVVFETALAELRDGRKQSHWMWFVFPQIAGLGGSPTARTYAIRSRAEARAYLDHELLGDRLRDCCEALLPHAGRPVRDILGTPDDLKLRSSMTLFDAVAPEREIFRQVLAAFHDGRPDERTLELLEPAS